ncbi:MAG: TIGR02594 family protein [Hyphomicrobiaceae bacterium]
MRLARAEIGTREIAGTASSATVLDYYRDAGHGEVDRDEVPWCAAFVGAMLRRAGVAPSGSLMARSYLSWGDTLSEPHPGAVVVLSRTANPALGHVGFLVERRGADVLLLGGNQSDRVGIDSFPLDRVLGYRWPHQPQAPSAPSASAEATFAAALAHVLEVEGGYSDDPYDPGGPTNKGITLATYAAHTGTPLTAGTRERLVRELKSIPDALVATIYRQRYWQPAGCHRLPAGLCLMHFDAAVNQGVGRAIRFLQQVVGTDVDGELGPLTAAAVSRADMRRALPAYADLRRKHYQGLSTFWRFGRGWLRRLDLTLARARAALASPTPTEGDSTMIDGQAPIPGTGTPDGKWWGESMTIWGTLITALSAVLPVLGPLLGLNLTSAVVEQLGGQIVNAVQAVAAVFGTLLTIYGRTRATLPLTRKRVSVRL